MTPEIELLWKLHELDDRRVEIAAALSRFPQMRGDLEHRVTAEREKVEASKAQAAEIQKKRRDRERDIEVANGEERKFQSQLPAVKKNEEYTALLHEIAGVKTRRSNIETEVLILLEDEDRVSKERPALVSALEAAEKEKAERLAVIDREEAADREILATIDAERGALIAQLPPAIRLRYERVHASRAGRAVVPILKGACGGCHRTQSPQMLQDAKRGDRMLSCDGCGRLVVWPPGA